MERHKEISMIFPSLDSYIKWVKAHEKLIIIAVLVLFGLHVYDTARQAYVDHLKRQDDVAAQTAQASNLQNAQTLEQLADLRKQVTATNAALDATLAQRAVDNQKQKKADDALAGQQLAARLQSLLNVNPGDVTWSPTPGNLTFSLPAAHDVADVIDDKNKLTADVQDLQTKIKGDESVIVKQTDAIVSANLALADEKNFHQKDVALLKGEMHGQFMKGFKWGYIAGAVSTVVVEKIFHVKL
jgi:hypothetical protein